MSIVGRVVTSIETLAAAVSVVLVSCATGSTDPASDGAGVAGVAMGGAPVTAGGAAGNAAGGSQREEGGSSLGGSSEALGGAVGAATGGSPGGQGGSAGSSSAVGGTNSAPCAGTGGPAMVMLPEGYCIDSTEVTRAQYQTWLDTNPPTSGQGFDCDWNTSYAPDADCMNAAEVCSTGCDAHPQVCVDWCDAYAYCRAVGKRLCGKIGGGANGYDDSNDASLSQWFNSVLVAWHPHLPLREKRIRQHGLQWG